MKCAPQPKIVKTLKNPIFKLEVIQGHRRWCL